MLGETARNPSAKCLEGLPEESLSLKKKNMTTQLRFVRCLLNKPQDF